MKKQNTRALSVKVLLLVVKQGVSFQPALVTKSFPKLASQEAAFISYLCFGVLRFYFQLDALLTRLLAKPLKAKDDDIKLLLMLGLYQLFHTDIPPHAILNETVAAVKVFDKSWALGLLNGVLRQAQRDKDSLVSQIKLEQSHPVWLVKELKQAWPAHWRDIISANLTHPPLTLRVNQQQISREDYLKKLEAEKIAASPCAYSQQGIILEEGLGVEKLPGFTEGLVSVQDCAAQFAAPLLDLKPNLRVLDACAAPGGKMAHILEMEPDLEELWAIEKDPERYHLLGQTLQRLKLNAKTLCASAEAPEEWFDGRLFSRILIDAPCSATGVIRRHPDIMIHRQPTDIASLVKQQENILSNLWTILQPSGILLYITCSILPQENEMQIYQFLQKHPDAKCETIEASWGMAQKYGRQIHPGQHNMDGFYYAKLIKKP